MIKKTITAKFETIDMAELAARGITNNFHHVSNIKIRFKNFPEAERGNIRFKNFPEAERGNSGTGRTDGIAPTFFALAAANNGASFAVPTPVFPADADLFEDRGRRDIPEIEQSTESRIVIEANDQVAKDIAGKLRCLGGYEIEVSFRRTPTFLKTADAGTYRKLNKVRKAAL